MRTDNQVAYNAIDQLLATIDQVSDKEEYYRWR